MVITAIISDVFGSFVCPQHSSNNKGFANFASGFQDRIRNAVKYIPADRLMIAPDCGLGLLPGMFHIRSSLT